MKRSLKNQGFALPLVLVVVGIVGLVGILAWSPWVTERFAYEKVKQSIKPPCQEYKNPIEVINPIPPPKAKTLFGRFAFLRIQCPPAQQINNNKYFVSFVGTTHQISSKVVNSTSNQAASPVQTDEMADWKVYKNTKVGYEIRYPKDWEISEEKFESNGGWLDMKKDNSQITLGVADSKYQSEDSRFFSCNNGEVSKITLDNVETDKCLLRVSQNIVGRIYLRQFTKKRDFWYVFQFDDSPPYRHNSEKVKIFDQILSTFKFLD